MKPTLYAVLVLLGMLAIGWSVAAVRTVNLSVERANRPISGKGLELGMNPEKVIEIVQEEPLTVDGQVSPVTGIKTSTLHWKGKPGFLTCNFKNDKLIRIVDDSYVYATAGQSSPATVAE